MKSTDILSTRQSLTTLRATLLGGLIAGTLDAVDGVIAFGTQGLNPIQVLQYIASGALGQAGFPRRFCYGCSWRAASLCNCVRRSRPVCVCEPMDDGLENTSRTFRAPLPYSGLLLHELPGVTAVGSCAGTIPSRSVS
jgi:hypothetical protein